MSFAQKTWSSGDIITADELNRMEEGITSGSGSKLEHSLYIPGLPEEFSIKKPPIVLNKIIKNVFSLNEIKVYDINWDFMSYSGEIPEGAEFLYPNVSFLPTKITRNTEDPSNPKIDVKFETFYLGNSLIKNTPENINSEDYLHFYAYFPYYDIHPSRKAYCFGDLTDHLNITQSEETGAWTSSTLEGSALGTNFIFNPNDMTINYTFNKQDQDNYYIMPNTYLSHIESYTMAMYSMIDISQEEKSSYKLVTIKSRIFSSNSKDAAKNSGELNLTFLCNWDDAFLEKLSASTNFFEDLSEEAKNYKSILSNGFTSQMGSIRVSDDFPYTYGIYPADTSPMLVSELYGTNSTT